MGKDLSDSGGSDKRKFAGMTVNPWWHGYYTTNYIKAAIYATRIADAIGIYGDLAGDFTMPHRLPDKC